MKIVTDSRLPRAAQWALGRLRNAVDARMATSGPNAGTERDLSILVGLVDGSVVVRQALAAHQVECPDVPESAVVCWCSDRLLALAGRDELGLVYALTEAARAIELCRPEQPLPSAIADAVESPELAWRSIQVFLNNEELEREWYFSERFWDGYLSQLAYCRYNNISLTFGHQTPYLSPPYPFLTEVPGFPQVNVPGLAAAQRQKNLDMLRRILEMARERGLHFTLSVWSQHAYRYGPAMVEGLSDDILADFNAAGLRAVLEACPAIDGVQFRMNAESGVPEAQQLDFYEKQFRAIADCGRPIRLDLRAKGLANATVQRARTIVPNTVVSTKFWCEHLGMPYPMPAIQKFDVKNYRRYGMWDLLEKPRIAPLFYRLWSAGSQRVLTWGDPEWVRRFAQSCHFGAGGFEVMAPLTNKGGVNVPGRWRIIDDPKVQPFDEEYQRYWMFFLLFGRLGYRSDCSFDVWRRELAHRFGPAAAHVEQAQHFAGQILPIVTTVFQHSASLWAFWPEMWHGRSLAEDAEIEPSDPTQFYGVAEYVNDALNGALCGKWPPYRTAAWLDRLAEEAIGAVQRARDAGIPAPHDAEFNGLAMDLEITASLGHYHAARLRACTHFAFFQRMNDAARLDQAVTSLRAARDAWQRLCQTAEAYHDNLIFGLAERGHAGHWRDRLPMIDAELQQAEALWRGLPTRSSASQVAGRYPGEDFPTEWPEVMLDVPAAVALGSDLPVCARVVSAVPIRTVRCHYRVTHQVLPFETVEMREGGPGHYDAVIPAAALDPRWDLMVFMEAIRADGEGFRFPDWRVQTPYLVVEVVPRH